MHTHVLHGRRAVGTGGSSGLGRATAVALAGAGAGVAVLARGVHELEQACAAIRERGRRALGLTVDLADADAGLEAAGDAARELGGVGILVNAAGTNVPGPVSALRTADWDRVHNVNPRASFLLAKALWPHLVVAHGATIVNVSSVAAAAAGRTRPRTARRRSASRGSPRRSPRGQAASHPGLRHLPGCYGDQLGPLGAQGPQHNEADLAR